MLRPGRPDPYTSLPVGKGVQTLWPAHLDDFQKKNSKFSYFCFNTHSYFHESGSSRLAWFDLGRPGLTQAAEILTGQVRPGRTSGLAWPDLTRAGKKCSGQAGLARAHLYVPYAGKGGASPPNPFTHRPKIRGDPLTRSDEGRSSEGEGVSSPQLTHSSAQN